MENAHRWPQVLPGGKAVLFNSGTALNFDQSNIVVQVVATGKTKIVQRGGYFGRYLPNGYLVFLHDGTMFAAPFDIDRLETTAQPVPVIEDVTSQPSSGAAQFAFANDGTVTYLSGLGVRGPGADSSLYLAGLGVRGPGAVSSLYWMDRAG